MTIQHITREEAPAQTCVHHWIIEPAHGPTSGARCRLCGQERDFFNNPDAVTDNDARSKTGFGQKGAGHHRSQAQR